MISTSNRKKLFDLLCRNSSPDFIEYLRVYEGLPQPPQESFEISCELVNGIRVDSMRLAILWLQRRDVLRWLSECHRKIPFIQEFLFDNKTEGCFGIGLADYLSGSGVCRMKIYNFYGSAQPESRKTAHIQQAFSLLNIPDVEFMKDWKLFRKIEVSGIDWDREGQPMIKVYFGPFPIEQLFSGFSKALSKEEFLCYNLLKERSMLPETFVFCARYSLNGRSLRTGMRYRTKKFVPYLKMFDNKKEVTKFFVDFYRIFPSLELQVITMQWLPIKKMQFYFLLKS